MTEQPSITQAQKKALEWLIDGTSSGFKPAELLAAHEQNPKQWKDQAEPLVDMDIRLLTMAVIFPEAVLVVKTPTDILQELYDQAKDEGAARHGEGLDGLLEGIIRSANALGITLVLE